MWSTLTEYLAANLVVTVDAMTRLDRTVEGVTDETVRLGGSGCGESAGAVTLESSVPAPLLRNDFSALERCDFSYVLLFCSSSS